MTKVLTWVKRQLMAYFGASRENLFCAVAIGYIFLFTCIGSAQAIKWADSKLKK